MVGFKTIVEKDDKQLISAYMGGDEDAFLSLVSSNLKPVYNFVYRLSGNQQDAEDITQETFIKVWKKIKKYDDAYSFKTWLYAIARNTAVDFLRKKRNILFSDFENDAGENSFLDMLVDAEVLPDEVAIRAEQKDVLERALASLSPLYREVLLLKYNDQFTFDEIGRIVGRPLDTVKSQYCRALILLKKLLIAPK